MKVNLLISKEEKQVMFLEAGKDFVDLLMSLLRMPVASLLKLLKETRVLNQGPKVGIFNVYSSTDKLEKSYLMVEKDVLLNPSPTELSSQPRFLRCQEAGYYTCPTANHWYISLAPGLKCASCQQIMTQAVKTMGGENLNASQALYTCAQRHRVGNTATSVCPDCSVALDKRLTRADNVQAQQLPRGFVKETVTFMVKDDLEFFPISIIKSITGLSSMGVKSFADMESKEIVVTNDQALALVQAALASTTALNDVFGSVAGRKSGDVPSASGISGGVRSTSGISGVARSAFLWSHYSISLSVQLPESPRGARPSISQFKQDLNGAVGASGLTIVFDLQNCKYKRTNNLADFQGIGDKYQYSMPYTLLMH
ncbi:unnamed protein product [Closterium sp. Yama58-4]|nr:unnamed protein product [Closterium sp. Yama58-4]